jgi:hypothetical protein
MLVAGLGGGCDVLLAWAVARLLPPGAARVVWANLSSRHCDLLDGATCLKAETDIRPIDYQPTVAVKLLCHTSARSGSETHGN